jgi:hypothetical protein
MENDIQISPLPWRVKESGGALCPTEVRILDANDVVVCWMETSRNKRVNAQSLATAKAIVNAMNAKAEEARYERERKSAA